MTESRDHADLLMARISSVLEKDPALTPIQAAILAACALGIASDSRTFANRLGIEHALVLREIDDLAEDKGLLTVEKQEPRTLRQWYRPSGSAEPPAHA